MIKRLTYIFVALVLLLNMNYTIKAAESNLIQEEIIQEATIQEDVAQEDIVQASDETVCTSIPEDLRQFALEDYNYRSVQDDEAIIRDSDKNDVSDRLRASNTKPIADLNMIILNPETMIDDEFTDLTMIAFLWKDETISYSYDPDGDTITHWLDGLPSDSIIGNVTLGNEVVGFIIQLTTPAQYRMRYYVVDSNNMKSSDYLYWLRIEPSNGAIRPYVSMYCSASYDRITEDPPYNIYPDVPVYITWGESGCFDNATITAVSIREYHSSTNTFTEFIEGVNARYTCKYYENGVELTYHSETGSEIWLAVIDSNGNWSDYEILEIQCNTAYDESVFYNLSVDLLDLNNELLSVYTWVNYAESKRLASSGNSAATIYSRLQSNSMPDEINGTLSGSFRVTGTVYKDTGGPDALREVVIVIPVPKLNRIFLDKAFADSSGNFAYECDLYHWCYKLGLNDSNSLELNSSGKTAKFARYYYSYSTEWFESTEMRIYPDGGYAAGHTANVGVITGISENKILADTWRYNEQTNKWTRLDGNHNAATTSISIGLYMNGDDIPTQNYSTGGLRYALKGGSTLQAYIYYYDTYGDLNTLVSDTIHIDIYNSAWSTSNVSYHTESSASSSNGISKVVLKAPSTYGENVSYFTYGNLYFDTSVRMTIRSETYGTLFDSPIYITSRIMS